MDPQRVTADPRRELEMLLASRFALIVIESREEGRVLQLVREASLKAGRAAILDAISGAKPRR